MQKKHVSPEFTVIKQDEANAKFFVASFDNTQVTAQSGNPRTTSSVASTYGAGSDNGEDGPDSLW